VSVTRDVFDTSVNRKRLGVELGVELGPALVLVLDALLGRSTRRYREAWYRRCTARQYSAIP
jgi:hypothetical protein